MVVLDYNYLADLVINAQNGDSDAFAELYAATYQKQYHFAFSYLKDEYLAQDALQESYILALRNLSKLRDPMLLIAWLNQINFRVCFHLHKKQERYNAELIGFDHSDSETSPAQNTPPQSEMTVSSAEELIVQVDSQKFLMKQILNLPFTESQVIILKFYRNLKHDEIAKLMDISRSTVKRYLKSGKEHLEKLLQQQGGDFFA